MRTINTLAELKEERLRLQLRKTFLEAEIKNDFNEIKEQVKEHLKPIKVLSDGAKMLGTPENHMVGNSVGFITNVLVKNVLLKNAGFLSRLIVPYFAKNVASNVAENNKPKIAAWINDLIEKFTHKKAEANA